VLRPVTIVDDGDPAASPPGLLKGYTDTGNLSLFGGQGFQNDVRVAQGAGESATYTFGGLVEDHVYQVSATYTAHSNRATDAPYAVSGVKNPATVPINQRFAPNDFTDQGVNWETLGVFTIDAAGVLQVTLTGSATGDVLVDAIHIERLTDPEIEVRDGATNLVSGSSAVNFGSVLSGGTLSKIFTVNNVGADDLTLQPVTVPTGFLLVGANFTPGQIVTPGDSAMFEIAVNTATPGTKMGTLSFANNDPNESPFTFTLTAQVAASQIIDNGDSGYVKTAGFATFGGQGFQNDVDANDPGGADTATWTFTGLPAGSYRVSATWTAFFNRSIVAPFSINGGAPILVNQKLAPNNAAAAPLGTFVTESGANFADLSVTATPVGGTITVVLSEPATGQVIADAIRIERLGPLHAGAAAESVVAGDALIGHSDVRTGSAFAAPLASEIDAAVAAAIDHWSQVVPGAAAQLGQVQVTVTELPGSLLGLGSFTSPAIWLDTDAAGFGWHSPFAASSFGAALLPTSTSLQPGIDLLTVVTHELGHVLGFADLDPNQHRHDVMSASLLPGVRRVDVVGALPLSPSGPLSNPWLTAGPFADHWLAERRDVHTADDFYSRLDGDDESSDEPATNRLVDLLSAADRDDHDRLDRRPTFDREAALDELFRLLDDEPDSVKDGWE